MSSDPVALYRAFRRELEQVAVSADSCKRMLAGLDEWEQGADLATAWGWVGDPSRYQRNARHGRRLDDRDEAIRELGSRASGSPWRKAQAIAEWRTRLARGDRLTDLPADTGDLLAVVGDLSVRQMYRVLSGDRSA